MSISTEMMSDMSVGDNSVVRDFFYFYWHNEAVIKVLLYVMTHCCIYSASLPPLP